MIEVTDDQFENIISESMDELPEAYIKGLNNVAIIFEQLPTEEQHVKLKLRGNETLFGLYEGIPRPQRGTNYSLVLPDKITLFKKPLEHASSNVTALKVHVKHTLWHEIAHHYGLGHDRIHEIEDSEAT